MQKHRFLAFDLGAESGRCVLGTLEPSKLRIRELRRFPNKMIQRDGHFHWDLDRLFREIKTGIRCAAEKQRSIDGIGIDTWGVDFGLVDRGGFLLEPPYAYRDPRTRGVLPKFFRRITPKRLYRLTGIQIMEINTLFQLYALKLSRSPALARADNLLFMPDLFNYLLTGVRSAEYTIATTSQLVDARTKDWCRGVFEALGVPVKLMAGIIPSGTAIGPLKRQTAEELSAPLIPVIATAGHDTAAAVAAVPAQGNDWAFISSGTWSLMGVESMRPFINDRSLKYNFSNEGGAAGTFRCLKNITGLWLVQQCFATGSGKIKISYPALNALAAEAEPFRSFLDPDDPEFHNPPDMWRAFRKYFRATKQKIPGAPGAIARSIYESLALKYRWVLEQLNDLLAGPIRKIHIVGGGSRNPLLCQFTANATGLPVIAGPAEASAIGNIMIQALARNRIGSLAEARAIIRGSFPLKLYEPIDLDIWSKAYERFRKLTQ
jgi:rhamnulokinase